MAYEGTQVGVAKSQEAIRRLILKHEGNSVGFFSQPGLEGFQAEMILDGKALNVRILAKIAPSPATMVDRFSHKPKPISPEKRLKAMEEEQRRVWRVLFYYLKAAFEAAETGVVDIRELMMPYVVTKDGRTIAEHIMPQLEAWTLDAGRMLGAKV